MSAISVNPASAPGAEAATGAADAIALCVWCETWPHQHLSEPHTRDALGLQQWPTNLGGGVNMGASALALLGNRTPWRPSVQSG